MKNGYIYRLLFPNGKSYIGITVRTVEKRFAIHVGTAERGGDCAVHCAIRKYGPEAILVSTLVIANAGYLRDIEKSAINSFNTKAPLGYNMTDGGNGSLGYRWNKKQKNEQRLRRLGKPLSAEHRAKIAGALIGHGVSPEARHKLSIINQGNRYSLGRAWTAEGRAKLSAIALARITKQRNV